MWNRTRVDSPVIGVCQADFARFPAIWTVVFSVGAEADTFKSLAIATVAIARALSFRLVALHAQHNGFHICFPLAKT
jgi:hypothetical protein